MDIQAGSSGDENGIQAIGLAALAVTSGDANGTLCQVIS